MDGWNIIMEWCFKVVNIVYWSTLHNKNILYRFLSLNILLLYISSCVIWCKFITNNIINYVIKTLSLLHISCTKAWFLGQTVLIEESALVGLCWFRREMLRLCSSSHDAGCSAGLNSDTNDLSWWARALCSDPVTGNGYLHVCYIYTSVTVFSPGTF